MNENKKSNWIQVATLGVIVLSGVAQAGTGIGGGVPGARDQYLASLRAKMGAKVHINGAGAPFGGTVSEWCSRAGGELRFGKMRADNLFAQGLASQAKQALIDAMVTAAQAIEVGSEPASPITKQLLDRGLMLSQSLDAIFQPGDVFGLTTEVNFLDEYVGFVIRTASELDLPYYVPYIYQYGACGGHHHECPPGFNVREFERRYLAFAREQLDFTTRKLTEIAPDGHGSLHVFPVGDGRAFLTVAEFEANWVSQDLATNLFAAQEACVAQELSDLSGELTLYNDSNDRTVFPTQPIAVFETHNQFQALAARIPQAGCARAVPIYEESYPAVEGEAQEQ